jgi:2-oxoisovalerate dehydrogenase E2 component (dihydrolipoyl transacylase)
MAVFRLPDLGEGLTEAEILGWRVGVGDTVRIDQIIVEVETAKAAVEVPVPFAGVVTELHGSVGEVVNVGEPLITVSAVPIAAGPVTAAPAPAASTAGETSGNVLVGYGTSEGRRRLRRTVVASGGSGEPARANHGSGEPADSDVRPGGAGVAVISPLIRRIARDAGLDLSSVSGSGPHGIVQRRDLQRAIVARASGATEPTVAGPAGRDSAQRIPLRGTRKAIAEKLARSRREIPEATVWVDVDATELLNARAHLNARNRQSPVSILALVAHFALLGLRRYPALNSRVADDEIVIPDSVNLGFAAQTDRGLVVPVVHDANRLTVRELSTAMAESTAAARAGGIAPADLAGGTFTVNNYGVFGVDGSVAIINYPEVAILGIGRIVSKPWVVDGQLAIRSLTQLSLVFDHRVCDGGVAGGFLRFVADCVEVPITVLDQV